MLADALRAEAYRFWLNRPLVFVSTLLTPLIFAVGGIGFHVITKQNGDRLAADSPQLAALPPSPPVNLGEVFGFAANGAGNGVILICILIAAATLYAGDYRWETWRLISARNDRLSLILAKVGVVKLIAIVSSLFFLIASLVFAITQAVIYERGLTFSVTGGELGEAALIWFLSYIRIVQFTLIGLLTAVMTRSLMAALFVPWALGFVQSIFGTAMALIGWEPHMWAPQLLLPGLAYDTLKAIVAGTAEGPLAQAMWKSILGLTLWTLVPLGAAIAWFQKQDLSKE